MDDRILVIRAGGTIDSEAYDDPYHPPEFVKTLKGDDSLILRTIAQLPGSDRVDGMSWGKWDEDRFVKDSQKFTKADIDALAEIIKKDSRRYFVLTHGTDAMAKMVPLSMAQQHPSDAVDALRFTLAHIGEQGPDVHLVGRDSATKRLTFFDPRTVEKNRTESLAKLQFTLDRC